MYSALKYNDKKLCEFVRKGIEVERESGKVAIKKFEVFSYDESIVKVRIECSSRTYIRALAQDLGNVLKCGATVKILRREKIDVFDIKRCFEI
jgi:tRNA pseudouridine55 synthase